MDRFEISQLRSYYGKLLTSRQDEMLKLRYDDDLSFGEIAELLGVSRQAVLDGIVKGEKHLQQIDEALELRQRDTQLLALVDRLEKAEGQEAKDVASKLRELILQ